MLDKRLIRFSHYKCPLVHKVASYCSKGPKYVPSQLQKMEHEYGAQIPRA